MANLFMFRLCSKVHLSAKQITGAEENPRSRANAEEKGKPDSPTCPSDSCPYVEHLEAVANASSGFYLKYASKLGVLRNERSWWLVTRSHCRRSSASDSIAVPYNCSANCCYRDH